MLDRRSLLATGIVSIALIPLARAASSPLRLGIFIFSPYTTDNGGKIDGILIDIWRRIAARAGIDYTFVVYPPARVVAEVAAGNIDVTLLPYSNPELSGRVISSRRPIETVILEIYAVGRDPDVNHWQDLRGRSVIVQHGFAYGGLLAQIEDPNNGIEIAARVPNTEDGLRALLAGRGEVMLHYRSMVREALETVPVPDLRSSPLSRLEVHINLTKTVPEAMALMARIDAAIDVEVPVATN